MRFDKEVTVEAGQTTIIPRVGFGGPENIDSKFIFHEDAALLNTNSIPARTLCALEGNAGDTATIQFWVLDDAGWDPRQQPFKDYGILEWYQLDPAVNLVVGEAIAGPVIPAGWIYIQVTAGPAAQAKVKVGSAP